MTRKLLRIVCIAVIGLCWTLAACENEAESAADELGIQKGRRPTPSETRRPPGPPNPEVVTEEEAAEQTGEEDE